MGPEPKSDPSLRVQEVESETSWPPGLRWLGHRRAPWLLFLVAVALHLPAMGVGLLADDYVQIGALEAPIAGSNLGPFNLYDFGTLERDGEAWGLGGLPWWTSEEFRVRFLRPVPSLVRSLEHAVVGRSAWPGQLANALAMGLLTLLVARLHRALGLGAGVAVLAALLFAVDESSALPVGWLANRNSLGEALFGVAALLVALGGVGTTTLGRQLGALVLALLATLSKESGIVFLVLVPMAVLWRARGSADGSAKLTPPPIAVLALGPVLAALYLGLYVLGDYGANSGFYPEPWAEPLATLGQFVARLPVAVLALSSPVPADLVFVKPGLLWVFGSVGAVLSLWLAHRLWRAPARTSHRSVLALLGLFFVSLAPQAAAPMADRLLFVPAIAYGGILALALASGPWRSGRRWGVAGLLLLSALPLSALGLLGRLDVLRQMAVEARNVATTLEPAPGTQHVWMLQGPNGLALLSLAATWPLVGGEGRLAVHNLQLGPRSVILERRSSTEFEVLSRDEPFLARPMESVFLGAEEPTEPGRVWRGALFQVTALDPLAGAPTRLSVRFDAPPESLGVALFRSDHLGSHPLPWPAVGESLHLARSTSAIPLAP